jgi:acetyl esterase/lipase
MDASNSANSESRIAREARAGAALTVADVEIPGYAQDIALRLYRRADKTGLPVVLYFHGGGFVARSTTPISPRAF